MTEGKKQGELYSRQYIERGKPLPDSPRFRARIAQFAFTELEVHAYGIRKDVILEVGASFPAGPSWPIVLQNFFNTADMVDVLSGITVAYRHLRRLGGFRLNSSSRGRGAAKVNGEPQTRSRTAAREAVKAPRAEAKSAAPAPEPTPSSTTTSSLAMNYPLRENFIAQVVLPRNMTNDEARRLCAFIRTLAVDFTPGD